MATNGEVRKSLEEPFPADLVRTRPGSFGQDLSYVEAVHYIERLNQAYDGQWSFEIVSHEVGEQEVIVVGKFVAPGIIKMAFGSSDITRRKDSGEIVCLGDDLKAASTDALKKAASLLGVGLHLYGDDQKNGGARTDRASGNGNGQNKGNGNGENGNGRASRLTSKQHQFIMSLAKEKGISAEDLDRMSLERFAKSLAFISKADGSSFIQELQDA